MGKESKNNEALENFLAAETSEEFKSTLFNLIDNWERTLRSPHRRVIGDAAKSEMKKYKARLRDPDLSSEELDTVATEFFNTEWHFGGMDLKTKSDIRPKVGSQYKQFRERKTPRFEIMGKEFFKSYPDYLPSFEQEDNTTEMPEEYREGGRVRLI